MSLLHLKSVGQGLDPIESVSSVSSAENGEGVFTQSHDVGAQYLVAATALRREGIAPLYEKTVSELQQLLNHYQNHDFGSCDSSKSRS
jgi:hypothetical protein